MQIVGNLLRVHQVVQQHMEQSEERRTNEFLGAASRGDVRGVRRLLQQHINPDAADYDGAQCVSYLAGCTVVAAWQGHACYPLPKHTTLLQPAGVQTASSARDLQAALDLALILMVWPRCLATMLSLGCLLTLYKVCLFRPPCF